MAQNGRASAVAKKDASVAIGPVGDRGQFLRADDEHSVVGVRGDELLRDLERKEKSGAGGGDIETGGVVCSDLLLNETGRGREKHVGSGRCHENEIDLLRGDLRLFESP